MKNILLTSTALVAFAGAAFAESHSTDGFSFSGDAALGFNDDTGPWGEDGFYWDVNVAITMSKMLDNGLKAAATFNIEIDDEGAQGDTLFGNNDYVLASSSYVLSLTSESASLYFGDVAFAAETQWKSAGDMEADAFSEADGEVALRGDMMFAGVSASVSMLIANEAGRYVADDTSDSYDQLSFGVSGDLGMYSFSAAYQEEATYPGYNAGNGDFEDAEAFGISAGATFAGADITVAYAQRSELGAADELNSFGVKVAYPFGPVTATVYYVAEDTQNSGDADDNYGLQLDYAQGPVTGLLKVRSEQDREEWNVEGAYDLGNGLTVLAGALNENEGDDADFYVGGTYDLGGGATILAMFAEDKDGDQEDEIGSGEYMPGTTVEVNFTF
tara:strand:+ start:11375 stop:12535 length:1161 start_codon:yes stop_codon:yes gene_type:complete